MERKFFKLSICILMLSACKKDIQTAPDFKDNYADYNDFITKNEGKVQVYFISGINGGTFKTPQGTVVRVPPHAFVSQSGIQVTGAVTINFIDVYKKSDMVLSGMDTYSLVGLLKSGGEFFIQAFSDNSAVQISAGSKIDIVQPVALTAGMDPGMQPFIFQNPITMPGGWLPILNHIDSSSNPQPIAASLSDSVDNYIFSLYSFNSPVSSGTWCNSDNLSYFSAYPQTPLTFLSSDSMSNYNTQTFLIFKNINSMVHVYGGPGSFVYNYAPRGFPCTLVAIGFNNHTLYSSFTPFTIGVNQKINFTLSPTTTGAFKAQLQALN